MRRAVPIHGLIDAYVIGGLAYGYGCDALETDGLDELTNTYYTVEQYQALFSEFLASHPEIRGQLDS